MRVAGHGSLGAAPAAPITPCLPAQSLPSLLPPPSLHQAASSSRACTTWRCCAPPWSAPSTSIAACWGWRWVAARRRQRSQGAEVARRAVAQSAVLNDSPNPETLPRMSSICCRWLVSTAMALSGWPAALPSHTDQPRPPAQQAALPRRLAVDWARDDPPHGEQLLWCWPGCCIESAKAQAQNRSAKAAVCCLAQPDCPQLPVALLPTPLPSGSAQPSAVHHHPVLLHL